MLVGSPGSRCPDRVRNTTELLEIMPVKDKGKREQSRQEEPACCDASLTPVKGEGERGSG